MFQMLPTWHETTLWNDILWPAYTDCMNAQSKVYIYSASFSWELMNRSLLIIGLV